MSDVEITIEGPSQALIAAYVASGLDRGAGDGDALAGWFSANPYPFAVARAEGDIVGVSAYIWSRMQFGAGNGQSCQAVDSFVRADMRGRGIFSALARAYDAHACRSGADLVWGLPNDNAAPAWFGGLGWHNHGQVPFLIKPLRAGYFLRRLGLPLDFPLGWSRDQHIASVEQIGPWGDALWRTESPRLGCATVRDRTYLSHRLFGGPHAADYRVVADPDRNRPSLVATRQMAKHGGNIAYLMEALGGDAVVDLLHSELGRLRDCGVELVLAWCFPWSPNYGALRKAGFIPLPEQLRPIRMWFGGRPRTGRAAAASERTNWYLSYLDSDTV